MLTAAHFVLVHGAGHGAWCWFMVQCLLETAGYNVTSLDLAGPGVHPSDPDSVRTFPGYDKPLFDFINALPKDEKGFPDLSKYGDVFDKRFSGGNNSAPTTTSITLKKEFERELLYQLSPRKDSTLASKLLRPWPIQAITNARFSGGEEKVKRVRRVFIKTRHDHMVNPKQQDAMIRRWPPSKVLVINTDHSPFFSAAKTLSKLIIQAAVSK